MPNPAHNRTRRPKRYHPDRLDSSAITPEMVHEWWAPRFGDANPQRMNNPLWEWLVRTRIDAHKARGRFGYPRPFDASRPGPAWCFERMGQSVTRLPDGRAVMIAGEHEDSYDPDFQIYNDVTVQHPDGTLDIYGYPGDVFPPTDFHTATLVDRRIIIIGNLGYKPSHEEQATQVFELDTVTWAMRRIVTAGPTPGWLHKHVAELSGDGKSIVISGGLVKPVSEKYEGCHENPDQWALDLTTWEWQRLTQKPWENYALSVDSLTRLPLLQGLLPDPEVIRGLYHPPVPHEEIPDTQEYLEEAEEPFDKDGPFTWDEDDYSQWGEDFRGTRISVQGVVVRYKEEGSRLLVVVEGALPPETVSVIVSDITAKLESLLQRPVQVQRL
ncbi:MAG: hypothetical protein JWL81_1060 [Verrucomicrobiales bacterium]|nr:hypothetical protein [Verrucomicrobiales bacterium]